MRGWALGVVLVIAACTDRSEIGGGDPVGGTAATGSSDALGVGTGGSIGAAGDSGDARGPATGGTGARASGGSGSASVGAGGATGDAARGSGGSSSALGSAGSDGACVTAFETTEANNYRFHSSLDFDLTKVEPSTDLFFDWIGVNEDLLLRPVDPGAMDMIEIGLWNLTPSEFAVALNDDTLQQSSLSIFATITPAPGQTSGSIYDLTAAGSPLAPEEIEPYLDITRYPPENHVYAILLATGTRWGQGTRMLKAFQLDAASDNDRVMIDAHSTTIDMSLSLSSLVSPIVVTGEPHVTIDWTHLTKTAAGLPFEPDQITEVRVGKFSLGAQALEDPANFITLDLLADTLYSADVTEGTSFDLADTRDADGHAFPGIDLYHTWLVALNCGHCANPAPWYLTVLAPCGL